MNPEVFKAGDRVYHRTRKEWGVFDEHDHVAGECWVTFPSEGQSLHITTDFISKSGPK